ncbi:uncharacterized protein MONOS_1342 [Monocercomonoides exilis]|uniref:uncharacterized protein n=1 Tax=Monocercomonoides exilis TaxID=2049356 RepID=UPI003559EF03|nr:hypothetical protein MONOS_1342 [Monocercomonoides exilis]|eukprot:MONOS_1342.1-p1 / transcript=MONOS_1342.1 / gene=MONOS_1342 / organism=Monocercomonoides_exilis_PA203 / gene_product=unspecified product / transcript_product=unspecified product / location=Mono_scaffold00023:81047-81803(+) / protein_length=236 / sequence_SO=supercontig / SO=protein_coding / is_pseudo=false
MANAELNELQTYLKLIDDEIDLTSKQLNKLTQQRSHASLLLSERIRKITDYKSKFEESVIEETPKEMIEKVFADIHLPTPSTFPYVRIATFTNLTQASPSSPQRAKGELRFVKDLSPGLSDVEGFGKAWLICVEPNSTETKKEDMSSPLSSEIHSDSQLEDVQSVPASVCIPSEDNSNQYRLILVDILGVNVKKGIVSIEGEQLDCEWLCKSSVWILDFKVYIPYIEARIPQTET